jgi:hypothetical protein
MLNVVKLSVLAPLENVAKAQFNCYCHLQSHFIIHKDKIFSSGTVFTKLLFSFSYYGPDTLKCLPQADIFSLA